MHDTVTLSGHAYLCLLSTTTVVLSSHVNGISPCKHAAHACSQQAFGTASTITQLVSGALTVADPWPETVWPHTQCWLRIRLKRRGWSHQWKPMNRSTATENPAKVVAPIAIPIGPPAQRPHVTGPHGMHLVHRVEHMRFSTDELAEEVRTASSQEAPCDEARVH